MGLDLYAGTFTRYYTRNWKTVVEAWAEANGVDFKRTDDGDEEKLSPDEVREIVCSWRDEMLAAVTPENQLPETWEESNDKAYYTDKPDWDAFGAMLLVAAAHTYEETIPETLEKGWDFTEHPLIKRLSEDHEHVYSLFRSVMVWVPIMKSTMVFRGPMPTGDEVMIGTLAALDIGAIDHTLHRHHGRTMHLLGSTRCRLRRSGLNRPCLAFGLVFVGHYGNPSLTIWKQCAH